MLEELSGGYTTEANRRVCQAMLTMGKIDVAALQAANLTARYTGDHVARGAARPLCR